MELATQPASLVQLIGSRQNYEKPGGWGASKEMAHLWTHTQEEKHFESCMGWHVPVIPAPLELKQEDFEFQERPNIQNKGRQTLIYEKSIWMMGNFWRQMPIKLPVTITNYILKTHDAIDSQTVLSLENGHHFPQIIHSRNFLSDTTPS